MKPICGLMLVSPNVTDICNGDAGSVNFKAGTEVPSSIQLSANHQESTTYFVRSQNMLAHFRRDT
jgi:hypothetical protein